MVNSGSSWNAIVQYSFLRVFANDGTIDAGELDLLEKRALEDGVVDDRERAVLGRIFARVEQSDVTPEVCQEMRRFKERHGIP